MNQDLDYDVLVDLLQDDIFDLKEKYQKMGLKINKIEVEYL